jgi:hypothetical protein
MTLFHIFRLENMGRVALVQNNRGENSVMTQDERAGASEVAYSFQPSVLGAGRRFRLSDRAIIWDAGRRSGQVAFNRVTRVRMSYRPATLQAHRFITEIWSSETPKLTIASSSWKSMVELVDRGDDYRAFVVELHRRLAAAGSQARFESGIHPLVYWIGCAVFVASTVGFAALATRAAMAGARVGALLIVAFLLAFLWQVGNIFHRNRPGSYRPDALPPLVLPRVKA